MKECPCTPNFQLHFLHRVMDLRVYNIHDRVKIMPTFILASCDHTSGVLGSTIYAYVMCKKHCNALKFPMLSLFRDAIVSDIAGSTFGYLGVMIWFIKMNDGCFTSMCKNMGHQDSCNGCLPLTKVGTLHRKCDNTWKSIHLPLWSTHRYYGTRTVLSSTPVQSMDNIQVYYVCL